VLPQVRGQTRQGRLFSTHTVPRAPYPTPNHPTNWHFCALHTEPTHPPTPPTLHVHALVLGPHPLPRCGLQQSREVWWHFSPPPPCVPSGRQAMAGSALVLLLDAHCVRLLQQRSPLLHQRHRRPQRVQRPGRHRHPLRHPGRSGHRRRRCRRQRTCRVSGVRVGGLRPVSRVVAVGAYLCRVYACACVSPEAARCCRLRCVLFLDSVCCLLML
jgi:hypothetical protein